MHIGLDGILLRRKWQCGCLCRETDCSVLWAQLSAVSAREKMSGTFECCLLTSPLPGHPLPCLFSHVNIFWVLIHLLIHYLPFFILILPISLRKSVQQSTSRCTLLLFLVISFPLIIMLTYILLMSFYVLLFLLSHHRIVLVFPFPCSLFSKRMF